MAGEWEKGSSDLSWRWPEPVMKSTAAARGTRRRGSPSKAEASTHSPGSCTAPPPSLLPSRPPPLAASSPLSPGRRRLIPRHPLLHAMASTAAEGRRSNDGRGNGGTARSGAGEAPKAEFTAEEIRRRNMNILRREDRLVTLVAVPCILGVNLTGKDLMEFIRQLDETDGSSNIPQAVLRILNYKACRGAIMFGDPLLPSECSLIIEELKATSLCFQCAHGRPTTVPIVNIASLHDELARLEMLSGKRAEAWHGLAHQGPSLERAQTRLKQLRRLRRGL